MKCGRHKEPAATRVRAPWNAILASAVREGERRHRKLRRQFVLKASEKSLHALRIESRRLEAMVALAGEVCGKRFGKIHRLIKGYLRRTRGLRDAQVQARLVDDLIPKFPELEKFRRRLGRRIGRAGAHAQRELDRGQRDFSLRLRALATRLGEMESAHECERSMLRSLSGLVRDSSDLISAASRDDARLHQARVALKRLRYTVEPLAKVLPGAPDAWLRNLKIAQRAMGDVHDYDVLAQDLKRYVAKRSNERRQLRRLKAEIQRRRSPLRGKLRLSVPVTPGRLRRTLGHVHPAK